MSNSRTSFPEGAHVEFQVAYAGQSGGNRSDHIGTTSTSRVPWTHNANQTYVLAFCCYKMLGWLVNPALV